jgi:virulence factor Mce-like protein
VPADVHATIVPLSLIGERYVQLFPAWTHGEPKAKDGHVIPQSRTSIPVEPDEALAAIKHLLDSLDPKATGRLVKNLGDDLNGTGPDLNGALKGLADLTTTLADKDDQLLDIIDHFDQFSATLATREAALGKVMDGFAQTTGLLADERRAIESLVKNLATVATDGLDLTSEHAAALDHDLTVLTRVLQSVNVNIDSVRDILDATPLLVAGPDLDGTRGLAGAWDPVNHRIDLRNSVSPTVAQLFQLLGLMPNVICTPLDVNCQLPTTTTAPGSANATQAPAAPGPTVKPESPPAKPGLLKKLSRSLAEVFS